MEVEQAKTPHKLQSDENIQLRNKLVLAENKLKIMNPEFLSHEFIETYFDGLVLKLTSETLVRPSKCTL